MDVKVSKSSNPRTQSRSVKTPYTCNARGYVNADGLIRLRTRSTYTCTLHKVESILYLNVAMDECGCEYDDHFYMRSTFTTVLLLELQLIHMRCRQTETSVRMRHQMCIGKQGRSLDV